MVIVFRYGHRIKRDKRITSHVFLVARAFLADGVIYCGDKDKELEQRIEKLVKKWKGNFFVKYSLDYIQTINELKNQGYYLIHLTMYGDRIIDKIEQIKKLPKNKLIVFVGSKKVPTEIYKLADFNISITLEPHSEISALAIFLNQLFDLEPLKQTKNLEKFKQILQKKLSKK